MLSHTVIHGLHPRSIKFKPFGLVYAGSAMATIENRENKNTWEDFRTRFMI